MGQAGHGTCVGQMRLMPRRRPKPQTLNRSEVEAAICIAEFRPGAIAPLIERGQQLPIDHAYVRAHPEFFRGLVRLGGGEPA